MGIESGFKVKADVQILLALNSRKKPYDTTIRKTMVAVFYSNTFSYSGLFSKRISSAHHTKEIRILPSKYNRVTFF